MPFLQWFLFLFCLISMLIYTLIVITLKKHRSNALLSGSFFQIVEMQYYSELLFFIEFSLTMRFRKYSSLYSFFEPDTELHGIIPRLVSGFHYYIKIVVYIGYLTFAMNRFTSAINISSYNSVNVSIWTPQLMKNVKILKWTLPLIGVLPSHAWPGFSYWFIITTSSIRLTNDSLSTTIVAYVDGICCLGTCIFCMICYSATCFLIRKNWNRVKKEAFRKNNAQSAAERSLLVSAILSFVVLILNTAVQVVTILISWGGATTLLFVQDLSYPMIDLMYSHFPWALLVTSGVLRKQMICDTKIFLRTAFKLDDASVNTIRVGQTVSPATQKTTNKTLA
ncbi:Protein CBG14377 [Caenorhabditis briggsae]|uniref:Protein CBG14377 n=1 Tax=Caenorhabditis briggsae TaxID=6238 RepID=A8XJV3_CAEBR|nr:Protein CBG14377 [Caenorhabditis briggsae]CAP32929.2 Protein CBG14377 [Caenorhabditis briggsae]